MPIASNTGFSHADTALVDELAVLIGTVDPEEQRRKEEEEWRELVAEAEGALDVLSSSESTDNDDDQFEAEILSAADVIDAETLASRQRESDTRSTAQRARADQTWAYGHVIVDEAQSLERNVLLTVLSRIGQNSKVVLTHDVAQRDNLRVGRHDGVAAVIEKLKGHPLFAHITLLRSERSPIAALVTEMLEEISPNALP